MLEIKIPRENANDDSVLITKLLVKSGSFIGQGEVILEYETSKSLNELCSPCSGVINCDARLEGQLVEVDTTIAKIHTESTHAGSNNHNTEEDWSLEEAQTSGDIYVSNKAAELLESGLVPVVDSIWITSKNFNEKTVAVRAESTEDFSENKLESSSEKNTHEQPYNSYKLMEIDALKKSSPSHNSTLSIELNVGKRRFASEGFENLISDLIVWEAGLLLAGDFSYLRRDKNRELINVGYALDLGGKLRVPRILHNNSLADIQKQIIDVALRYECDELKKDDYGVCDFTVSDLTGTKIKFMQPLISSSQPFILGVTKLNSNTYDIFGTFDHRVTEGMNFSRFLEELVCRLKSYFFEVEPKNTDVLCFRCGSTPAKIKNKGFSGLMMIHTGDANLYCCPSCYISGGVNG